jgi:ATP-dependent DNA helicase RecG
MAVQKVVLDDGELAVVEVQPSDLPPIRYKGRVYIRTGPRRGIANEQEERTLNERRIALARSFDANSVLVRIYRRPE